MENISKYLNEPWVIALLVSVVIMLFVFFIVIYLRKSGKWGKKATSENAVKIAECDTKLSEQGKTINKLEIESIIKDREIEIYRKYLKEIIANSKNVQLANKSVEMEKELYEAKKELNDSTTN